MENFGEQLKNRRKESGIIKKANWRKDLAFTFRLFPNGNAA